MKFMLLFQLSLPFLLIKIVYGQKQHGPCKPGNEMEGKMEKTMIRLDSVIGNRIECVDGFAADYPCLRVDQESFVSINDLQNSDKNNDLNDIWGWSHGDREFAIVGLKDATSFVDITDPVNPIVLGTLETFSDRSIWRDIKTYGNYAFIVSEARKHGMQIFDLRNLLTAPTSTFSSFQVAAHYSGFTSAHNIFINEASSFAYCVGTKTCSGGLHMIDISDPLSPVFAGCYSQAGYVHDVQCVIYDGPDKRYEGREICFASDEETMDIIDVTNKTFPELISSFSYKGKGYVHQGWLTEDKRYFLLDDEQDEYYELTEKTKTILCDVSDLQNPVLSFTHLGPSSAIDHNQYVKGNFVFQSNYRAGLRILDLNFIGNRYIKEVAFFDTDPNSNSNAFAGSWSNYPYFNSGVVVISDIYRGLFIVRPNLSSEESSFEPSQSLSPSNSNFPSSSPSMSFTPSLSLMPSISPSNPVPSSNPSRPPSTIPSMSPSKTLTTYPTKESSSIPSTQPSETTTTYLPTGVPSMTPSNRLKIASTILQFLTIFFNCVNVV